MTIPVLRAFTKQYPEVKLTVLTRAFFKPFFRDLDHVSVFSADLKGKHKGFFGLLDLSKELRTLGIDAVADLHNVLRSNILKIFLLDLKIIQSNDIEFTLEIEDFNISSIRKYQSDESINFIKDNNKIKFKIDKIYGHEMLIIR